GAVPLRARAIHAAYADWLSDGRRRALSMARGMGDFALSGEGRDRRRGRAVLPPSWLRLAVDQPGDQITRTAPEEAAAGGQHAIAAGRAESLSGAMAQLGAQRHRSLPDGADGSAMAQAPH